MKKQGFASMTKEKRHTVVWLGGIAAHRKGTAHTWTSEEARNAGKIGGKKSRRKKS